MFYAFGGLSTTLAVVVTVVGDGVGATVKIPVVFYVLLLKILSTGLFIVSAGFYLLNKFGVPILFSLRSAVDIGEEEIIGSNIIFC